VEAIVRRIPAIPGESNRVFAPGATDAHAPQTPFRIVNIGGGRPIELSEAIAIIERMLRKQAVRHGLPMQPGDVPRTCADPALLKALSGFRPATPIASGLAAFVGWYRDYARDSA
jgi:UDP-glucuronate 4-epimerase